jgi:hypothetical protein
MQEGCEVHVCKCVRAARWCAPAAAACREGGCPLGCAAATGGAALVTSRPVRRAAGGGWVRLGGALSTARGRMPGPSGASGMRTVSGTVCGGERRGHCASCNMFASATRARTARRRRTGAHVEPARGATHRCGARAWAQGVHRGDVRAAWESTTGGSLKLVARSAGKHGGRHALTLAGPRQPGLLLGLSTSRPRRHASTPNTHTHTHGHTHTHYPAVAAARRDSQATVRGGGDRASWRRVRRTRGQQGAHTHVRGGAMLRERRGRGTVTAAPCSGDDVARCTGGTDGEGAYGRACKERAQGGGGGGKA